MKSGLYLSLFLLLTLLACSKSGTKVAVTISNSFSLKAFTGGAQVYVENLDSGVSSSIMIPENSVTVTLPNGNWKFTVVGWDGTAPMTGNMFCGGTSAVLNGSASAVNITLSRPFCDTSDVNPLALRTNDVPYELRLVTCTDLGTRTLGSNCDGSTKGLALSYRVKLIEFQAPSLGSISPSDKGLTSACIPGDTGSDSTTDTGLKLPYGRADGLFATVIESFSDDNCKLGKKIAFFPRGIANSTGAPLWFTGGSSLKTEVHMIYGGVALTGPASFGAILTDTTKQLVYTLTNKTNVDINIQSVSIPTSPFSVQTNSCGSTVTSGTSCSLTIEFDSDSLAVGVYSKSLSVAYTESSVAKSTSIPLRAAVGAPAFLTISGNQTFQSVPVNVATQRTYTITNTGGVAATAFTFPSPGSGYAFVSDNCGAALAPAATCSAVYSLTMTSPGTYPGTIDINYSNGGTFQDALLTVSGTTVNSAYLTFSLSSYAFPGTFQGATQTQVVTLTNSGNLPATNVTFNSTGSHFSVAENTGGCLLSIAASGGSCALTITFSPQSAGNKSLTLTSTYQNGITGVSTDTTSMSLTGAVAVPATLYAGASVSFGGAHIIGRLDETTVTVSHFSGTVAATSFSGTISTSPYAFKGGSFPGTGGTCGSPLAVGGNCTLKLTYLPVATGSANANLTIYFNNGQNSDNIVVPVTGSASQGALLDVTGTTNHGVVNLGATSTITYTLTNNGTVSTLSMGTPSVTGDYSLGTNTCPTNLAVGASCTFDVSFSPTMVGTQATTITVNYDDGSAKVETKGLNGFGKKVAAVQAYYANGAGWNDYVDGTNTNNPCNTSTSIDCIHGGDRRKAVLDGLTSCSGVTASDSLNVLDWVCDVEGGTAVVHSVGLKKGKGLRDLLTNGAWLGNTLTATSAGVTVYESTPVTWWSNPVFSLNGIHGLTTASSLPVSGSGYQGLNSSGTNSGSTLLNIDLIQASGIYTISTNVTIPSIHLGNSKISIVTLGASVFNTTNSATNTCNNSTGNASGVNVPTFICGGTSAHFPWIEVKATGNGGTTLYMVFLKTVFGMINNSELSGSPYGVKISDSPKKNVILNTRLMTLSKTGITIFNSNDQRIEDTITYSTKDGLIITDTSLNNTVLNSAFVKSNVSTGFGIKVMNGSNSNRIIDSQTIYGGTGIQIETYDNILTGCKSHANQFEGLVLAFGSTRNKIVNFQAMHNIGNSIHMIASTQNTFQNLALINNLLGLKMESTSTDNTFVNMLISGTGSVFSAMEIYSSDNNQFELISTFNAEASIELTSSDNNIFTKYTSGGMRQGNTCYTVTVTGGSNTINGSALANSFTGACPGTIGITLTSAFKGLATSDSKNPQVTATPVSNTALTTADSHTMFDNEFRYWSPDATSNMHIAAATKCTTTCEVYDWRNVSGAAHSLISGSGIPGSLNETFTPASPCPTAVDGSNDITNASAPTQTFLVAAIESKDGTGDHDGLCESNETCIYSPNIGAYQGEGSLLNSCTFTGGGVSNVTIQAYQYSFGQ